MSAAGNDDKSPLIDLIRCIVCDQTMKLEKSSPDAEGSDIIQYRCSLCNRIELVRLFAEVEIHGLICRQLRYPEVQHRPPIRRSGSHRTQTD